MLIIKVNELLCASRFLKCFLTSVAFDAHRILARRSRFSSQDIEKNSLTQPSRSEKVITHAVSVTTTWSRRINEARCGLTLARPRRSNWSCSRTERRVSTVILMSLISWDPVFLLAKIIPTTDETCWAAVSRPAIDADTDRGSICVALWRSRGAWIVLGVI